MKLWNDKWNYEGNLYSVYIFNGIKKNKVYAFWNTNSTFYVYVSGVYKGADPQRRFRSDIKIKVTKKNYF